MGYRTNKSILMHGESMERFKKGQDERQDGTGAVLKLRKARACAEGGC